MEKNDFMMKLRDNLQIYSVCCFLVVYSLPFIPSSSPPIFPNHQDITHWQNPSAHGVFPSRSTSDAP